MSLTINISKKQFSMTMMAITAAIVLFFAVACSSTNTQEQSGENAQKEQESIQTGFTRLTNTQQVPSFDWSQERQTLIDVETIRATGATSTTAFYLEGIGLQWWCPSVGAPVPASYQLSATKQWVDLPGHGETLYEVDQGEPTGVYIGPSTGTWTLCLDDNGKKFAKYWEGYVDSTIGVVTSYPADKRVVVQDLTFEFVEKPR